MVELNHGDLFAPRVIPKAGGGAMEIEGLEGDFFTKLIKALEIANKLVSSFGELSQNPHLQKLVQERLGGVSATPLPQASSGAGRDEMKAFFLSALTDISKTYGNKTIGQIFDQSKNLTLNQILMLMRGG